MIERNTPVPIEQTRVFTTVQDNQEAVAVRIYQGESRSDSGNECLGEFEFTGFESKPRGEVKIEVTFAISTEGIVKVSARDPNTGANRSSTVKMSSGLSEAEIQKIIAQAEAEPEFLPEPDPMEKLISKPRPKPGAAKPAAAGSAPRKVVRKSTASPANLTEEEAVGGIELPEDNPPILPPLPKPSRAEASDEELAEGLTKEEEEGLFGSIDQMLRDETKEEI